MAISKSEQRFGMRNFQAWTEAQDNGIYRNRIYIGLCGRAQHGKSSLCASLMTHFSDKGKKVITSAFATVPKKMLLVMGLEADELWGGRKAVP